MILYLDTSALVKLFVAEDQSARVRGAVARCRSAITAVVAYGESVSAFARLSRERGTPSLAADLRRALDEQWAGWDVVALSEPLVRQAADLAMAHGLRAYDSIHLASLEAVSTAIGEGQDLRFAVFDQQLATAARDRGFAVL